MSVVSLVVSVGLNIELCTISVARTPVLQQLGNQIHVWSAALSEFECNLPQFLAMLSSLERAKAGRFRFPKDRDYYVIRHGILRVILARYLDRLPSEVEFSYGRFGKPEIKSDSVHRRLNFNDSHSNDLALYAVTLACPVGVDVEKLRPIPNLEEVASRFFSPRETEMLMALPSERRTEAFLSCWTRKEAFLKATGEGLAKVGITLTSEEETEILHVDGDPQAQAAWQLRSFSPAPGYLAALAFRHRGLGLSQWGVHGLLDGGA